MSLKDQVEALLPSWRRWYPSLFDAATDLGVLRPRVCSPDSLLLSRRHQSVQRAAEAEHRKQWGAEEPPARRETARAQNGRPKPRKPKACKP